MNTDECVVHVKDTSDIDIKTKWLVFDPLWLTQFHHISVQ